MAPKKIKKASPKRKGKTTIKKTGLAGLYGALKGKIHYKDDSIFNLGI
ncbi:MAG: hypothetical protein J6X98_10765 [Bacteroidales bacterium]|nr:hypothetical protein [Bacteroidales bacterium]